MGRTPCLIYHVPLESLDPRQPLEEAESTVNFRWWQWWSSLLGLRILDPPLSPLLTTPGEIFQQTCLGGGSQVVFGKCSEQFSRHFR